MVTDKELLKAFQSSWSKNKYWVMSRSQQGYNQIRLLAKGNDWTVEKQQEYELVRTVKPSNAYRKNIKSYVSTCLGIFQKASRQF